MAKLSDDHKRLIVQRLAMFSSASEIIAELQGFGVTVSFAQIAYYDPDSRSDVGEKWKLLHAETRKRFTEETSRIGISHKAFRLRELDRLYRKTGTNVVLAKDLLVEAEKFTGGAYTNRHAHEVTGKDGKQLTVNFIRRIVRAGDQPEQKESSDSEP